MENNKFSEEEICSFMKDMLAMTISREQLLSPTKEFVIQIYVRFLSEFGIENVAQPDLVATTGVDDIERYETNIILANITKSVASLVQNAGAPDMSFADLVQPKKMRTNRIITALCMLLYKLTEVETKFSKLKSKCADLPIKRQEVEQRIREMKRQIEEKAMYLSSNKSKTQGLANELKELAAQYETKRTAADELGNESRQLKTHILRQREIISELDVEVSKLKEDIHDLDQKIVKSPDRIQADTKEKEVELDSKRNEKKKLEKQYMELIRSVDFLKESSKAMNPSLETFSDAFKDIENMKSQCENLCQTKLTVAKKDEQLKTFKVQLKEQEKTLLTLKTQLSSCEKQFQKQIHMLKQISDGMKNDLKHKTESKTEEERNQIEETLKLQKKSNDVEVEHKEYNELLATVEDKHSAQMKEIQCLINNRLNEVRALKQQQNLKKNSYKELKER